MRIDYRYGAAVGVLAAAFSALGPVAAQAGQLPSACGGHCGKGVTLSFHSTTVDRSIVVRSSQCKEVWLTNGRKSERSRECEFRDFREHDHFRHSSKHHRRHSEFKRSTRYSQVSVRSKASVF